MTFSENRCPLFRIMLYGDTLDQKLERSNNTIHKINTRVTTVTARRVVQLMPRLTHQSSAQLMITGTMISSCNELALLPLYRTPLEPPTPMLTAPPIFTQVSVPSTLTNPGPNAAHELPAAAPFSGSSLPVPVGLSGFRWLDCSANASEAGSSAATATIARRVFRIPPFIACHPLLLPDELDADRLSATPDHFAGPAGPCVARERQPQFRGQHVGIINGDLGAGRGHVLHHAPARRVAAIEDEPAGLAQRFAHFPFFLVARAISLVLRP